MALDLSPKLVDRYIFKQLLDYFLLGLVVFTLIAFFSNTLMNFIREVSQFGIPLTTLLTIVGLQLPKSVALVLPAASFLAALMVYNQMNNQFEITSFRTGGISLWRLMVPALVLGLLCSLLAYFITDYVVPYANKLTEDLKAEAIRKGTLPSGSDSFMFKDYDKNHNLVRMIYVSKYKGRKLGDSTIIDMSKPETMQVVQARSGEWHPKQGWRFDRANIYLVSRDSQHSSAGHSETFRATNLMSRQEDLERKFEELNKDQEGININSDRQSFARMWQVMETRRATGHELRRSHYLSLWEKITMPLSSLVIILSAVPLALTPPRAGHNRGFVFAVAVLFLYYLLHSVFNAMARLSLPLINDVLGMPAFVTFMAWAPILLMLAIGVALIQRKSDVL